MSLSATQALSLPHSAAYISKNETMFEVTYSGAETMDEKKYFDGLRLNDAITLAAKKITDYDNNPNVTAAYVTVTRLPDKDSTAGRSIFTWTKPYFKRDDI